MGFSGPLVKSSPKDRALRFPRLHSAGATSCPAGECVLLQSPLSYCDDRKSVAGLLLHLAVAHAELNWGSPKCRIYR